MGYMSSKTLYLLLLLLFQNLVFGQKIIEISVAYPRDTTSFFLKWNRNLSTDKQLERITDSIRETGYLFTKCTAIHSEKDTVKMHCVTGKRFESVKIDYSQIGNFIDVSKFPSETKPANLTSVLSKVAKTLQDQGMALSKLETVVVDEINDQVYIKLVLSQNGVRRINKLVFQENSQIPKSFLKRLRSRFRDAVFRDQTITRIESEVNNLKFVRIARPSEVLFTKDSTQLYIYDEKVKNNRFEGFAGLQNANNDLIINGYLDVALVNVLKSSEEFQLNWKTDGQQQRNFFISGTLPYIFNSNFVLRGQLNIFRQDSTFQTSKSSVEIGYLLKHNSRIFLGLESGESSDIQTVNTSRLQDFRATFYTAGFDFTRVAFADGYFRENDFISAKIGTGKSTREGIEVDQVQFKLSGQYNIPVTEKFSIQVNTDNFLLSSRRILINELYRFGGFNSVRGLNENILQGHSLNALMTNYYYLAAPNLKVQVLSDLAYFTDQTSSISRSVFAAGAGFAIATKNGIFNFTYAVSRIAGTDNSLQNALAHVSFKSFF